MSCLELTRVTETCGEGHTEVHALRDVDLSVESGLLVDVTGASGSGETTLLSIAGTLEDQKAAYDTLSGGRMTRTCSDLAARVARRSRAPHGSHGPDPTLERAAGPPRADGRGAPSLSMRLVRSIGCWAVPSRSWNDTAVTGITGGVGR